MILWRGLQMRLVPYRPPTQPIIDILRNISGQGEAKLPREWISRFNLGGNDGGIK